MRGELTLCRDLLLRGKRIVVPASLRTETLEKIHSGHQGIQRCLLRITSAVWWPQVKHEIEQLVQNCPTCTKASVPQRQPMIASELPTHSWEKVASDLFYLNGKTNILVADYFSRYLEVQSMSSTASGQTVQTPSAMLRCNQSHLTRQSGMTTDQADTATTNTGSNDQHRVMTRS